MVSSDRVHRVFFWVLILAVRDTYGNTTAPERDHKSSLIRLPSDYVRTQPPIPADKALKVSIDIGLWAIRDISARSMDMEIDLLIYASWRDYRVEVNLTMADAIGGRIPVGDAGPKLWLPVIAFRNCKGCSPLNFDPRVFLIHYHTEMKALWTVIRTVQKLSCNIDLSAFPMDRQNCKIQLENVYEDTSKVEFVNQNTGPYKFISDLKLSEFRVVDVVPGDCSATYGNKKYACIEVEIRLARVMGYHLTTTFAPTTLIVLLSWISFWLPVNLAPARITLGVTSLLTLATRLDQAQRNLPAVSYVKAIDIWMFACIFLVFASLVEFALSFYCYSLTKNVDTNPVTIRPVFQALARPTDKSVPSITQYPKTNPESINRNERTTTKVDRFSKFTFPGAFLVFNICYWPTYLSDYYND